MADLIDRDALMKKICGNECGDVCDKECENSWCNFYDYIMDAPAVNRWISCSDGMPELNTDVLVYATRKDGCGEDVIVITQYVDYIWFGHRIECEPYWRDPVQYFHSDYEITHWVPLPEPPEGGA